MKSIIFILGIFISTATFAESEQESLLITKIRNIVQVDKIAETLNLKGEANVWITIDENKTIHVERVEAGDFLKSFYIRKKLDGVQVDVDDNMIAKTFSVLVEFS
jgi:hypothetical protein